MPALGSRFDEFSPPRQIREQRVADCASCDWPAGSHPTPSTAANAPTADRSRTQAAGSRSQGLTAQGPLQKKPGLKVIESSRTCPALVVFARDGLMLRLGF